MDVNVQIMVIEQQHASKTVPIKIKEVLFIIDYFPVLRVKELNSWHV